MGTMSMFDVLPAPEFVDSFPPSYIRTTRVVGTNGRAVDTVGAPIEFQAVVMPEPSMLDRQADGSRLGASIRMWTQTWLTNGLKQDDVTSIEADLILWHGRTYTVTAVQDWDSFMGMGGGANFGPGAPVGSPVGFFVVTADLKPVNPAVGA